MKLYDMGQTVWVDLQLRSLTGGIQDVDEEVAVLNSHHFNPI